MITVTNPDNDEIYSLDCGTDITLADLQALLEAESSIPVANQVVYLNASPLTDGSKTLSSLGVADGELLIIRDVGQARASGSGNRQGGGPATAAPGQGAPDEAAMAEQLRQQVLADANLMGQLRYSNPQLAAAAHDNPQEFLRLLVQFRQQMSNVQNERRRAEAELANADEFDIDAQRRIEEAIQQENIMANLEHAMEFTPESFGRVTMLYIKTEINGREVKAFVDSGAQSTIMSPDCAERCGIMRLLDKRFAGIARGVGTAKILGRVHSAQIKLSPTLFLPCSFTIMEGKDVDCLFGLDMLKRHQACIDLQANALIINGEHCRFLDEHELPDNAKAFERGEDDSANQVPSSGQGSTIPGSTASSAGGAGGAGFPGAGQSLGSAPSSQPSAPTAPAPAAAQARPEIPPSAPSAATAPAAARAPTGPRTFPAESIQALKDLGASDSTARQLLEAAGGNVDVAAGLLFQGS